MTKLIVTFLAILRVRLNILNSAHTVYIYIYLVRRAIPERRANCTPINVQWLVFAADMASVDCAVRNRFLNTTDYISSLQGQQITVFCCSRICLYPNL